MWQGLQEGALLASQDEMTNIREVTDELGRERSAEIDALVSREAS